jgi:hypothetical protein
LPPSRSRVYPGSRRVIDAPLIHPEHLARVEGFVERAVRDGARILLGGRRAVEVGDLSAPPSERAPGSSPVRAGCPKPTQKPVRGTHHARNPRRHDACHRVSASCSSTHAPSLPADRLPRWLAHRSEAAELSSCAPSKSARLLTRICWATSGLPSSRDTESTTSRARHKTYLNPIDMPMLFHYHAGS